MYKTYEFTNRNVPILKKDIVMRILFAFLFLVTFVWQFVLLVVRYTASDLTGIMMGIGIFTMVVSLFMGIVASLYAYRSIVTISNVKKRGSMKRRINLLSKSTKKSSFITMYSVLCKVLAVIMLMVLASGVTYAILELIFNSTHSFYLPILLLVTTSGFNSVYHLQYEIRTINEVQEYNSIY